MLGSVSPAQTMDPLSIGQAFVDLSSWRKIAVSGEDALQWLNDLVTADLTGVGTGRARRSLLLSPTGRIRSEFTVTRPGGRLFLVQDPSQPRSVLDLLSPYVLSSDVGLEDRTNDLALFAIPGATAEPNIPGTDATSPSCLGVGVDLFGASEDLESLRTTLAGSFEPSGAEDVDAWRIRAGIPRFGVDATDEDLPQESGFEGAVSFDKGCYLGQEALAKVRNLGHPRRLLRSFDAAGPVSAGDVILVGGAEAGVVTSVTGPADGPGDPWVLLARIRWESRDDEVATATGVRLRPRPA